MPVVTHEGASHVLKTPLWLTIIRGLIVLIAIIILGAGAWLIHGAYLDEFGLAVATSVLTFLAIAYVVLAEKISACRGAYHIIAVIAVDAFMVIMWLATFAATAAKRAAFVYNVSVNGCYNDGSFSNSNWCWKRSLIARDVILFETGQDVMAAMAGLGALVWILYIVCLVYHSIQLHKGRKEKIFLTGSTSNEHQMESTTAGAGPEKVTAVQTQQPVPPPGQQQQQQQPPYQYQQQPAGAYQQPVPGQYGYPPAPGQQSISPVSPPQSTASPGPYPPPSEIYTQSNTGHTPPQELHSHLQPPPPAASPPPPAGYPNQHAHEMYAHGQAPYPTTSSPPPAQEMYAQGQQQYGQYPPQGYATQPYPPQGSPSPVSGHQNELDAGNHHHQQQPSTT